MAARQSAIRAVGSGEAFLTNAAERSIIREWMDDGAKGPAIPVTPREEEVVKLIAEAHTNHQIAEILHLSEKTVESHRANVLRKLGMRDRVELVRYAIKRGLVEPQPYHRLAVRAPVDHIAAPEFPARLPWFNVAMLRMDQQLGRPVLIEFWDFCRANSIRTLPYLKAWHERYAAAGLRVIGVHASGFAPSGDPAAVGAAVERLGVGYPVVVDTELEIWERYGNLGWPGRYLFDQRGMLFEQHYGEGAYDETEAAIQELLELDAPLLPPLRPEDVPGARLEPQSEDVEGPYSGPYRAGGVWAVLDGRGWIEVSGRRIPVEYPGAYELISHPRSAEGELEITVGPGVTCHAVCFTPGLDPAAD